MPPSAASSTWYVNFFCTYVNTIFELEGRALMSHKEPALCQFCLTRYVNFFDLKVVCYVFDDIILCSTFDTSYMIYFKKHLSLLLQNIHKNIIYYPID